MNITAKTALELIEMNRDKGTAFSVTFVKRTNGEIRTMNARFGVSKGVKGVGLSYDPASKNLLGVCDMAKIRENRKNGMDEVEAVAKAYRMVDIDTMTEVTTGGNTYTVLPR
jgi:hypothetical protein